MQKRLIPLLGLLALPVAASQDHYTDHTDTRTVIMLGESDRAHLLTEMRAFLAGLQQMTQSLARSDLKSVAATARSLGAAMTHEVPEALKKQLPPEFRSLGFSVHADFDRIALDAESLGDAKHTLAQLGETLGKCVTCHQAYQIRAHAHTPKLPSGTRKGG